MERSLSTGQLYSSRKTVKRREFVQWAGSWPTGLMLDPSDIGGLLIVSFLSIVVVVTLQYKAHG